MFSRVFKKITTAAAELQENATGENSEFAQFVTKAKQKLGVIRPPSPPPPPLSPIKISDNPIVEYFNVRGEYANAGPQWRIYIAIRKSDMMACSVFAFDKRGIDKQPPKQREVLLDRVRRAVDVMAAANEKNAYMVRVLHPLMEGEQTLAFATEPVVGSLENIFAWQATMPPVPGAMPTVWPLLEPKSLSSFSIADPPQQSSSARALPQPSPATRAVPPQSPATKSLPPPSPASRAMPPPEMGAPQPSTSRGQPLAKPSPSRGHPLAQPSTSASLQSSSSNVGVSPPSSPLYADAVGYQSYACEYTFLEIERCYGLLQILLALDYMHHDLGLVHCNVSPQSVVVTSRGTWKLFGLETLEVVPDDRNLDFKIKVKSWANKSNRIIQPALNFLAPEVQAQSCCTLMADMFSYGLLVCAVYNNCQPLIQANNSTKLYLRQIIYLDYQVSMLAKAMPEPLHGAVRRMTHRDPRVRPSPIVLAHNPYFKLENDTAAIHALQFLETIQDKGNAERVKFYNIALLDALPTIPQKLLWQNVLPVMHEEFVAGTRVSPVLTPLLALADRATSEEFDLHIMPSLKVIFTYMMSSANSTLEYSMILSNMPILLDRCSEANASDIILPILYRALEHQTREVKMAAIICAHSVLSIISYQNLNSNVVLRATTLMKENRTDIELLYLCLGFFEDVLPRLNDDFLLGRLMPVLLSLPMTDPEVVHRVARILNTLIEEKRIKVSPTFIRKAIQANRESADLTLDQFANLLQRYRDPSRRKNPIRSDGIAVPFYIPKLRRRTTSYEDLMHKQPILAPEPDTTDALATIKAAAAGFGQWMLTLSTNNSSNTSKESIGSKFLRVTDILPSRRSSDNTLMTAKVRVAPSSASSPGGTPASRCHSSNLPERRVSGAMPATPAALQGRGRGLGLAVAGPSHTGLSSGATSSSAPSQRSVQTRRAAAAAAAAARSPGSSGSQHSQGQLSPLLTKFKAGVRRLKVTSRNVRTARTASTLRISRTARRGTLAASLQSGCSRAMRAAALFARRLPPLNFKP